ncbi:hypothetical protein PQR57_13530 [Paraburkholderia dipogonis]|uniref:DUF3987 domain-containing protein n=1 Tax=Paraburkholderia dipogonis TaxID=1211383 RepID=A0ABW9AQ56_9BURK
MLETPDYIDTTVDKRGIDPLGNSFFIEALYRSAFPGINNVVQFIRVYSAICWMVRNVDERAARKRDVDIGELSRMGLEKIQLLLGWYNVKRGVKGLAGGGRIYPSGSKKVLLNTSTLVGSSDFNALEYDPEHEPGKGAFFIQADQYSPSLFNGMRFVMRTSIDGAYVLTDAGKELADGYELAIMDHPWRDWLANPEKLRVSDNDVTDMGEMLDLRNPSEFEIEAFVAQYYPEKDDTATGPNWENRKQGLTLAMRALRAEMPGAKAAGQKGVTIDAIRHAMARGSARDGTPVDLEGYEAIQAWWANLQLRQYFRAAQEMLLRLSESWVHRACQKHWARDVSDCANGVANELPAMLPEHHRDAVRSLVDELDSLRGAAPSLYAAGPLIDVASRIETLREKLEEHARFKHGSPEERIALRDAYIALIYCACEAKNFGANEDIVLRHPAERFSPVRLVELVEEYMDLPPEQFMAHVVRHYILLQHFRVVQERSRDGGNRFRLLNGDNGLERMSPRGELGGVRLLPDRLRHAVLLLSQCGLLSEPVEGYFKLTSEGLRRLKALERA